MQQMTTLETVHRTVARLRGAKGKQIHNLSASDMRLLKWLMDNKLWEF